MSNARSIYGTPLDVCRSAMGKALRRSDIRTAMWFGHELVSFGYAKYALKVPLVVAVEDCEDPMVSVRVHAIYENAKAFTGFTANKTHWLPLFLAKMVIEVARAKKSWESHHLAMWVTKASKQIAKGEIEPPEVPSYALDIHTGFGRRFHNAQLSDFWKEFSSLVPAPTTKDDEFFDVHGDDEAL